MSNLLKNEKSPYLLEHAENPVNWYPWCAEAFEKAKAEDKPIFLSIGYSTCHWCHVMARESFENQNVAEVLNRYFVSVKVDREERPDVDSVYMSACSLLNGSGGWPLTIIMTPEQKPFFAATYIPRENVLNRMGLISLLRAVAEKWKTDRKSLLKSAGEITEYMKAEHPSGKCAADGEFLKKAAEQLRASYDKEYGGFGSSPKFPSPQNLVFLMRYAALSGEKKYREMVDGSLKAMYRGGIYDHIGGGFCRYSTDREWLAPHFEKTLYDNALLAYTYVEAWQSGHFALYRTVAESVLDYCMRELLDENGGYFCGQDADSNSKEGEYYLFTQQEVAEILGAEDGKHFCECYDITAKGNFEGKNIPNLLINTRWYMLPEGYDGLCEKLRIARQQRLPLKTDIKKLTAWNGMLLMALSKAASVFSDARYLNAAEELAGFMERHFTDKGELKARLCEGELRFDAGLDDYAYYALGLLELYEADHNAEHISRALRLAGTIKERFLSKEGFCYRTGINAEKLIVRPKEIYDNAAPSGNSAAAVLFDKLWRITGDIELRDVRDRMLEYLCGYTDKYYAGAPFALCALMSAVFPTKEVLFVLPDEKLPDACKALIGTYSPELTVLVKSPSQSAILAEAAPYTEGARVKNERCTVYLCADGTCGQTMTI